MHALRDRAVSGVASGTLPCLSLVPQASARNILRFTEQFSSHSNGTELSVTVDPSDIFGVRHRRNEGEMR
jgi:hypothetical protein